MKAKGQAHDTQQQISDRISELNAHFRTAMQFVDECNSWIALLEQHYPDETLAIEAANKAAYYADDTAAGIANEALNEMLKRMNGDSFAADDIDS